MIFLIINFFTWIIKIYILQEQMIKTFIFVHLLYYLARSCGGETNCDPRCSGQCQVQLSNNECCACVSSYNGQDIYFWVHQAGPGKRCAAYCPVGYYQNSANRYCTICISECQSCSGPTKYECQSCTPDSYKQNSTTCHLLSIADNSGYYDGLASADKQNPCPPPLYGIYTTKKCEPCPVGCTQCNIFLQKQMPTTYASDYTMSTDCPGDGLCDYTLRCYECDTPTYVLQDGYCITTDQCRKYSKYNSTSLSFNPGFCICVDSYYLTGVSSCSRCHIECLTCGGTTSSDCLTCPEGGTEASGSCTYNVTYTQIQNWGSSILVDDTGTWTATYTGTNPAWAAADTNCPSTQYVFGYYGYDTSFNPLFEKATLTYTSSDTALSSAHYGIHFRAAILFIDEWQNSMSVVFKEGTEVVHAHFFSMEFIMGEYLCGRNFEDHIEVADFWYAHTTASIDLQISVSSDGYAWGIRQVQMHVLQCDPSCQACSGPSQYDCTVCDTAGNQILVDNDCVCNIDTGYFNNSAGTACVIDCGATDQYLNKVTRQCQVGCNHFPHLFKHIHTNNTQQCFEDCPSGYYKYYPDMTCVADCYDPSITDDTLNYYQYDGLDKVCYQDCPNGTYGDPSTGSCMTVCSVTTGNAGYFALGQICVQYCDSTTYAFHPTRQCLPQCPTGYYQNTFTDGGTAHNICEQQCSVTLDGDKPLGQNITDPDDASLDTAICVDVCPDDSFADYILHLCLGVCNQTSYKQTITVSSVVTRSCQTFCDSAGNDIYGNAMTGQCVDPLNCPQNFYGDPDTTFCESNCTDASLYGDNTTKKCQSTCTTGFKQNFTKLCVETCPVANHEDDGEYGDSDSGFCILTCPANFYADNQTNRECVATCADSPAETYGQNNVCVFNCTVADTWADPFHANRICTPSCTYGASLKSYGHNSTVKCVEVCPDTEFGIVISTIPLCVFTCEARALGTFGNPLTNLCVDECPQPYYGDPTGNRLCVIDCPDGYFAENTTAAGVITTKRQCVTDCSFGWADNYTRTCAILSEGCQDGLFAHETNNKCVKETQCTGFGDPVLRQCVPTCYSDTDVKYFGDPSTKMCVLVCPEDPDYYGDNSTDECQGTCTLATQVRDPQNLRRCVTACSRTPLALYADFVDGTCVTIKNCTADYFSDNATNQCESDCTDTHLQYADPISRECVAVCELGYYGLNQSVGVGICSTRCPIPEWADNLTVQCTTRCSNHTYGVNYTDSDPVYPNYGVCHNQCPLNQFARDTDNLCVLNCGDDLWGVTETRYCVDDPFDCPDGYYADDTTHMCVVSTDCSVVGGVKYVADNLTKSCLPQCPDHSVILNYGDMVKQLCVAVCPHGYFGYNDTKECQIQCKDAADTYTGEFADPQLRICVQICSAEPMSTFGQNDTYTCVQAKYCPASTWAQIQIYNRQCRPYCPDPRLNASHPQKYADNTTTTCVTWCPTYYYGDLQRGWGMCVDVCPVTAADGNLQFADNLTKTCVQICPISEGTWGDVVSLRCVLVCPQNYYAQPLPVRHCVQVCANDTWGQYIKRTCVDDPFDCPTINGTHFYADDSTTLCVQTCPQNVDTWGENSTWRCQDTCTTGFKYNDTRVCIDICPPSLNGDGSFSDQGMCYFVCMTANYYRDPQNARSCQSECSFSPQQYYADQTTMKCVLTCPVYPEFYYAYDPDKTCKINCPLATIKDHNSRKCVDDCPNNTFFDPNADECVSKCPTEVGNGSRYYGDGTQILPICVVDTQCPNNYFADDVVGLCVSVCTEDQWKYSKNCITHCPDGYFGNYDTGFCVIPADCPTDHYANNQTKTCVAVCNGTFADTNEKTCVHKCPSSYYADSATRLCSLQCTNNATISLHKDINNRSCISSCSEFHYLNTLNNNCESSCADPYYADRTTQICVSVCPSVPELYGQNDTNECLQDCNNTLNQYKYVAQRVCVTTCPSGYFRDNHTRYCVQECVNITYADDTVGYCVYNCSPRYSLDDPNQCVSSCPYPYYKDPTTYKCVLDCPFAPTYYKVVTSTDRRCDTDCPSGQFRDSFSYQCVDLCPPSPPTYADSSSDNCVTVCPTMYANTQTRICVSPCPDGMYAENTTRKCVYQCINGTDTYGDSTLAVPFCVSLCSSGTFADPYTLTCVGQCRMYPKMYGFDNTTHRVCLQSCPYPYVADNATNQCQIQCNNVNYPYLDKASKTCVASCTSQIYQFSYLPLGFTTTGTCVDFCPGGRFALLTNNSCVVTCPDGLYGDTTNNTCYENCTMANGRFADPTTHLCVDVCPSTALVDSYGDLFSRTCVTSCPADKHTVSDTNTRLCEPRCSLTTEYINPVNNSCVPDCPSDPLLFADPVTLTCVEDCSLYSERYGYIAGRTCVEQCPIVGLYADDSTRLCVAATSCPDGYWGLNSTRVCVQTCPTDNDLFGDEVSKTCVATCDDGYFADSSTRLCVQVCPQIPSYFGRIDNKRCVAECPGGTFADNDTRQCVTDCTTSPIQTYADDSTNLCVITCPTQPNYFASNQTYKCVPVCPSSPSMFADYSIRKCVLDCPGGDINTYADNSTRRQCVRNCPDGTFRQNSTRSCVTNCDEGFADPQSRYCIATCPAYTYGYLSTRICVTQCPTQSPQLYAEDNTHMCQSSCLLAYNTFADLTTKRCVPLCPISAGLFAETYTRTCMSQCPASPLKYADFSTRYCVTQCPTVPALYAINTTRVCTDICPDNSYSDNSTRLCVSRCPDSSPQTYGDSSTWTCVSRCPTDPMTYSDNSTQTCVAECPDTPDFYAANSSQRCVYHCDDETYADQTTRTCVETCPDTYYGYNTTMRCVQTCQPGEFADHLLNLCVAKCSVDPIYYGNPDTHICVVQCPSSSDSYGNPLTQQCIKQVSGKSGCPVTYFADELTRLCVEVCPLTEDTYGDNSTWRCVPQCPAGSQNTFSDNSTMRCVKVCPEYPEYYAQEYSRRCVSLCLQSNGTYTGSFADNSTRLCVEKCPQDPDYFSDNSTRRCVLYCPNNPLTFADYSTRRCVRECPSDPDLYGDPKTLRCVVMCPQEESTYADQSTRLCVKVCPQSPWLFGENVTNRCIDTCPNGTFADNSSRLCVSVCPQYPHGYGDPSTHRCVAQCPSSPDLYGDPITQQCVTRCPDGFYAENDTRRCLPDCPQGKVNYADNLTNRCVEKCPASESTYGDNSTQECVTQCPKVPFTYADNMTQMCLSICNNETDGGYAQNQTRICVEKCPDDSYGDMLTRYCIRYCPPDYYADSLDNLCVADCPSPYFADNTTWECVIQCPVSELIFGQSFNRTCTGMCPEGTYADSYSQECVAHCPGALYDTYAYEPNNTCLQQCPIPLYGYPVTYVCIDECINPYYENITDHRCYKCPDECAECTYPQNCIHCVADHYLYAGRCLESCPTFPVITYANPNLICGTAFECTAGYFALNTTKACVTECPSGYYKNNTLQACDACLAGCSYCRNDSVCITCNSTIALWDDNSCHIFCSPLRKYYTTTGCVSSCPSGTFLQLTTCSTCSQICKRCIVQPQNCLTCAEGFYLYNNLCTEECPQNTKAVFESNSLYCKSCDETDCTVQPLTYTVDQYIEDYQYRIRMKFNQPITITSDIASVIQIKQRTFSASRLLVVVYEFVDYTIIDYGNGEYVFVLNNFDTRDDADMEFQLQIIDPEAIQSQSGAFPDNTRYTVVIPQNDYYSLQDYNPHLSNYCLILAIVAFILMFFLFWTNQSIWMPAFDYFQMLFLLLFINIVLPPNAAYCLAQFRVTAFTFLSNIFSQSLEKSVYNSAFGNILFTFFGDLMFLRIMGYLYVLLAILVVFMLVLLLLWKRKVKFAKGYAKRFLKETFWFKHLHGIVYVLWVPTFMVGLIKMRGYSQESATAGFSIFSSFLFMLPMLAVPIFFAVKLYKLLKNNPSTCKMINKGYEYITKQEMVLQENSLYFFTNDQNEIDLKVLQQPRINQLLIIHYPIEVKFTNWSLLMPLIQYAYKFLLVVLLVAAFDSATAQLFIILLLNIIMLVYFIAIRPYVQQPNNLQYNNRITIHNLVCFTILATILLAYNMNYNVISYAHRVLIGDIIAGFIIYSATANLIYMALRAQKWYARHIWKPFVMTEMFQENYTLQYLDYKKEYQKEEAEQRQKCGRRSQFLEFIKLQRSGGLADMVFKDPNDVKEFTKSRTSGLKQIKKKQFKDIHLRPDQNKVLKNNITNLFQVIGNQKERSHKSIKSSERLSKKDRNKVRNEIFGDKDLLPSKEQYEEMKIVDEENEQENRSVEEEEQTEYEYEYIDEEYPQGTDIQQILKDCKKGDITMA